MMTSQPRSPWRMCTPFRQNRTSADAASSGAAKMPRRIAEQLLECAPERRLGLITGAAGDLPDGIPPGENGEPRLLKPPIRQIAHGRLAHHLAEPRRKARARHAGKAR